MIKSLNIISDRLFDILKNVNIYSKKDAFNSKYLKDMIEKKELYLYKPIESGSEGNIKDFMNNKANIIGRVISINNNYAVIEDIDYRESIKYNLESPDTIINFIPQYKEYTINNKKEVFIEKIVLLHLDTISACREGRKRNDE